MDITKIDEKWLEIPRVQNHKNYIVAISNTGKYRRSDGNTGILKIRHKIRIFNSCEIEKCSHIIAKHFLITARRPNQTCIDHITHNPTEYNVNDVRNLRWCTKEENSGFEEARENVSKAMKGTRLGSNNPMWKGDNVGIPGAYHRARKLYRAGKLTEEEFQPYKKMIQMYIKEMKTNRATS